jgi:hypothetical protein
MANAVEISFGNWRNLPVGTTITVVVLTDIGRYDWQFTVPAAPTAVQKAEAWSSCHPPIADPLGEMHDCWACGVAVDPAGKITNPVGSVGQLPPIAGGR